jgi:aryl-alcohol dehydrogenase-like predicted oxidoreductase
MRYRQLGKTGIQISEIGFGTWGIGGTTTNMPAYGSTDDSESINALEMAFSQGVNFFDTSNLYGWGHSESLLGQTFNTRRQHVIIATKAGFINSEGAQDFSADALMRSLEDSLKRLRTDYVDVFQLHSPERQALSNNPALWKLLGRLQDEQTIRCHGISARSPDDALFFIEEYPLHCVQVNFNLTDLRALQNGLFDLCLRKSVGIIVRTPLAFGFLTGRVEPGQDFDALDHRRRFSPEARARWLEAVALYQGVFGQRKGATPAQNALCFCLSFPCVSTAIPGMMAAAHVNDNLGATGMDPLDSRQLRAIEELYNRNFR